jgi:ketosteroid isomerase-like protein
MKKLKQFAALLTIIFLTSCNNGQTSNATTSGDDLTTMKELTNKWNDCVVKQDIQTLATLYADQVFVYGVSISKAQAISNKEDFFKKHTDFNQSITGDIAVTKVTDNQYKVSFPKRSSFGGKTSDVQGYLLFDKVDGNWKITNESDDITDKNVSNIKTTEKVTGRNVGEGLTGDFDGDGNPETAQLRLIKEGKFDEGGWQFSIDFTNTKIPSITFDGDQDYASLINEGKLDNDAGDELSVLTPPNHGTWNSIQTHTFKNGSWKELMEPVGYQSVYYEDQESAEKDVNAKSPEDIIFKENGTVYYWDNQNVDLPNGEQEFKLVKVKAKLK